MKRLTMQVPLILTAAIGLFVMIGVSSSHVVIDDVDLDDEEVTIDVADDAEQLDLSNWALISVGDAGEVEQVFRFPADCKPPAGASIIIHSGPASSNLANSNDSCNVNEIDLYWDISQIGGNVWLNSGDTACLLDNERVLVDAFQAGGSEAECRDDYGIE